ncbi:hypothetical protein NTH51_002953, partial [Vibrio fluvialis]|nr:hypothetical protein [Vibrio fluvialis]
DHLGSSGDFSQQHVAGSKPFNAQRRTQHRPVRFLATIDGGRGGYAGRGGNSEPQLGVWGGHNERGDRRTHQEQAEGARLSAIRAGVKKKEEKTVRAIVNHAKSPALHR